MSSLLHSYLFYMTDEGNGHQAMLRVVSIGTGVAIALVVLYALRLYDSFKRSRQDHPAE